tara:strand:+ start:886 stop:1158 length:273 start_codon:yes stop_codon:yes gene_type:complete
MNKSQEIQSLGYGSFQQKIVVRVDSEHVETFSDAFNTKPFRTAPDHADFIVQTSSTKRGDDETVMYDIDYRLPTLPSFKGWSILWGESVY